MTGAQEGVPIESVGQGRYSFEKAEKNGFHRGTDHLLRRPVVVNLIRVSTVDPDEDRRRNGIKALAALTGHGFVPTVDVGFENGWAYIVMADVDGETLTRRLGRGPLRLSDVVSYGAVIAKKLHDAHAQGMLHCDVKPGNVIIDGENMPRLRGFGVYLLTDSHGILTGRTLLGTAAYASPEQLRGRRLTAATDIYALGLILLECITGRSEYKGKALTARLERSPDVPMNLPRAVRELIVAMTDTDPERRPTAHEVAVRLRAIEYAASTSLFGRPARLPRLPAQVRLPATKRPRPSRPPAPKPVQGNGVFISYRRATSWQMARLVYGYLSDEGFDVFMDIEHINSGDFEARVLSEIERRRHFVVILQPATRFSAGDQSDWMHREIARALELERNVVPVMSDGFTFSNARLPTSIARLATSNGVTVYGDYFPEAMARLNHRFLRVR